MAETVTSEIALDDDPASRLGYQTVVRLSWSAADPLAVAVVVAARPDHPSLLRGRWVLLRDTLRALVGPAAEQAAASRSAHAHVRLSRDGDRVTFTLRSATLPIVVTVPVERLRSFLAETEAVVPAGEERWAAALDAEIDRFLDRS
jgi:Streptomyces sporulation and cell division protein, SsgA